MKGKRAAVLSGVKGLSAVVMSIKGVEGSCFTDRQGSLSNSGRGYRRARWRGDHGKSRTVKLAGTVPPTKTLMGSESE